MPLLKLVCPHCQNTVELNVTTVTLTRDCPSCRKKIVLQTAGRDQGVRRPAILTEAAQALEEARRVESAPGPMAVAPKVLEGDIRHRMLHDPEVRVRVKLLIWGSALVLALVTVVTLATYYHFWGWAGEMLAKIGHHQDAGENSEPDPPSLSRREGEQAARKDLARERELDAKLGLDANAGKAPEPDKGREQRVATTLFNSGGPKLSQASESEKAKAAVVAFLEAKTEDERMKHIRSKLVMEAKIHAYYQSHDPGPIPYESVDLVEGEPTAEKGFQFSVALPKGDHRKIIMTQVESGDYAADWASFVLYSEMDWAAFKQSKPVTPVLFRVVAGTDTRFAGRFLDSAGLVCLKIMDPRAPESAPVWGYAPKSSPAGRALLFSLKDAPGESVPLTLTLKYPELADSDDQVWVQEFVANGWVAFGR